MKVLVLGATGMLGHKLLQLLSQRFDVAGTVRDDPSAYSEHPVLGKHRLIGGVRGEQIESIIGAMAAYRPEAVINCIGVIKQLPSATDPGKCIGINALFPHQLAKLCTAVGARLVHISTDCVFSGNRGHYKIDDVSDATDLYGRSKFLGEVGGPGSLTLRTSIIGRELATRSGLVEWFISQSGKRVRGFARAIFSGLTTHMLSRVIGDILAEHKDVHGVWHISAEPISKYDLLGLVRGALNLDIQIDRDEDFFCDRSLDSAPLRKQIGFHPPPWTEMIAEMARDTTPYPSSAAYKKS